MRATTPPIWLLMTTILSGVAGAGSLVLLLFVPMLFDSPGSERNPATITLASSIALFPACCLLAIVLSWRFFRKERARQAILTALLPAVPALVAVLSIAALEIFYGGRFGG